MCWAGLTGLADYVTRLTNRVVDLVVIPIIAEALGSNEISLGNCPFQAANAVSA